MKSNRLFYKILLTFLCLLQFNSMAFGQSDTTGADIDHFKTTTVNNVAFKMVRIPAGSFIMTGPLMTAYPK